MPLKKWVRYVTTSTGDLKFLPDGQEITWRGHENLDLGSGWDSEVLTP